MTLIDKFALFLIFYFIISIIGFFVIYRMKPKKHIYFVSYIFVSNNKTVYGHCSVLLDCKLDNSDEIDLLSKNIAEDNGFETNVTIIFFMKIKRMVRKEKLK